MDVEIVRATAISITCIPGDLNRRGQPPNMAVMGIFSTLGE